jgi:ABC-type branched-subunit amino acid transport system ATPase component
MEMTSPVCRRTCFSQKGLLRTFQIAHEFSTLTVIENLMMVPDDQLGESLTQRLVFFR